MSKYDPTSPSEYDSIINQAADETGLSAPLLRKVLWNESRFDPKAVSKTGPVGIAQFTKATGLAAGLSPEDRFDPSKAIPAAARLLHSYVQKYDGDELKAALEYNQGAGTKGKPQIDAYDKGDWANIGEEGRNYMRNLLDVARSPKSGDLESFGGITPKSKAVNYEDAMQGIGKKSKVTTDLPESHGFSVEGKEQQQPNQPFGKDYWTAHGETLDEVSQRSTFFGFGKSVDAEVGNSVLGVAYRAGRVDNSFDLFTDNLQPTRFNSHIWTPEELEKIRTQVKNPNYINVVTGGSPENLDALIKMANDNFELDNKAADSGIGAKLSAGIIGAGVDPLTYVPIAGNAGKGFKMINKAMSVGAQSAGINVLSEGLRTNIAGGESHYAEAALGGLLFGAGMSAVTDAVAAGIRRGKSAEVGKMEDYVDEFLPASMRMEARETARNTGGADLSRLPPSEERMFQNYEGTEYAPLETERGAVLLRDGSILSDTNPINPQTLKEFKEINPERAAKGFNLGGLTEIGLKTLRSESPEIRGIASDLVRSPTGMESGTHGKFGATASDIHERLHYVDQRTYNDLNDAMKQVQKDPEWNTGGIKMSADGARQEIYKRAAVAIERPDLQANLSKSERKVMDIMKKHFDTKRELMENPSAFGNSKATSIFPNSRHKGTYVPHVYSREAKMLHTQALGGSDGLQQAIAESWLVSYRSRPEVKARVDEHLAEVLGVKDVTPDMVQKHAMDKAYGIAKTDEFTSSSVIDENIKDLVGIENNSFLEARNLFDSDMPITTPNGQMFSVNDLRDFDMKYVMPRYDKRVNGDVAIMGGTGETTAALKDRLMALGTKAEGNGIMKGEVEALKDTVKILTGRARRNQDTASDTAIRSLNDLSFFAKNAYMGAQNITEISGMLAKGNVKAVLHGIPFVRDLATRKSVVGAKELKDLHAVVFGKELDDLIRPRRADIVQRLRESTDTSSAKANVVGTLKFATGELAARSPWTKMLNGTANYLLDAARQGLLGDVMADALTGKASKFAKPNMLKSASISPEQWKGIQSLIREHATRDANGQFTIKDKQAFAMDPRSMDLWRMADKVADETMLRPHKVSLQDSKAYGAAWKMALQFKSFTIKSMNSKFLRSMYEAQKNNRAIDTALTWATSLGVATAYFAAQAHVKASALPKEQQKEYLKKALDPKMLAYAGLSRSSHAGAPMSLVNMLAAPLGFDQAKMVRSTILPKAEYERDAGPMSSRKALGELAGGVFEQIPAAGLVAAGGAAVYNLHGVLTAPNKMTERDYMTGLMNTHRELVPNDPITQQLLLKMYEANGVHLREKKK
ncbi:internal (core) protein D [Yersinia phage fPS-10]|uniref:Peptidoglycan transglycosylase gp16 n=1 Tax=Yersinia phage fPS-10 TaxID=2052933 RepID=A0A2H1X957_9CAUD|nr:internal (core) protein D [Yersinia phage fPS-10]